MQVLPSFDPSVGMGGNINVNAADVGCKVLLYNLSIFAIQLNFEDGATAVLHPGEANWWTLNDPTPTLQWTQYAKLNVNSPAISIVTGQLYRQDEEIEGTYPTFFGYQFNVGNTVSVSQGAFQVLQNDGNASGTVFAEATVQGSPGSNVIMQNQGLLEVLQWVGGVLTQIFKTDPGAASVIKLANTGLLAEVLGNLKVDGTTELAGAATLDGTLGVTGTTTLAGLVAAITTLTSLSISGTLGVTGNSSFSTLSTSGLATLASALLNGVLTFANAIALQWKDSGGTARTAMQVDGNNNTQIWGIPGQDKAQFLKSDGTLEMLFDLVKGCLNFSTPSTVTNGGTAGSATMWMPFQGSALKVVIIKHSGFQTGASNQDVALPTAFTDGCFFFTGGCSAFQLLNSGVAQNVNIITALAAAGGTSVFQSTINGFSFGNCPPTEPFDTIRYTSGNASQHNAFIILIGR